MASNANASAYVGRIKQGGIQRVQAPNQTKAGAPGGKVHKGTDLRTGKKGK